MKYEKSCGAVIFDGNKVLVIQQLEGHWGFPKGHIEEGETEVETAIREIKEETNLDVEIDETHRYVEHYSPKEGVEKDVIFFIAKKIGGEIKVQEEEVKCTDWLLPMEAMEKLTYESSKNILSKIIEQLGTRPGCAFFTARDRSMMLMRPELCKMHNRDASPIVQKGKI